MEKLAGDIIILHMCTKNHNHMRYDSWDTVWGRQRFLSFWAIFCPFTTPTPPPPLTTWKIKILKKWKKHLERSSWSYDVWFLRYKVRQTEAFVILGHFLPFDPTNNLKNQNFEKMKKKTKKHGDIIILHLCTTNDDHRCMVPEILSTTNRIFVILGHVLPFYPTNNLKNKNFDKMKKIPGDIILHKCTKNHDHILYCSRDMVRGRCLS